MSATMTSVAVQGRWGWHACDYSTFLKVKKLHKLALADFRATKRLKSWSSRLPHNRVHRNRRTGEVTPIPEPRAFGTDKSTYQWILLEYRLLRRPVANPESVTPLDLPPKWEDRLDKLAAFYAPASSS